MKKPILLFNLAILFLVFCLQTTTTLAARPVESLMAKLEARSVEVSKTTYTGLIWHDVNHNGGVVLWGSFSHVPHPVFCVTVITDSSGHYTLIDPNMGGPGCCCFVSLTTVPDEYPLITHSGDGNFGLYEGIKTYLPAIRR